MSSTDENRQAPLTDEQDEVRELKAEDMQHFRPIQQTDPGMLEAVANYRRRGCPPVASPKTRVGFRLATDVVAAIRASGLGAWPSGP
jgi:uncharacterized protein (DUF4415 family)